MMGIAVCHRLSADGCALLRNVDFGMVGQRAGVIKFVVRVDESVRVDAERDLPLQFCVDTEMYVAHLLRTGSFPYTW